MKISRDSITTLFLFFLLTIALYFLGYWLIFRMGKATPLMLSVGLAAILTCLIRKRGLSTFGWGWGKPKQAWMSYLIPLAIVAIAYIVIWLFGFGHWYNTEFISQQKTNLNLAGWSDYSIILFQFLMTASMTFILSLPAVLGEEIAWRGFLVTELSKFLSFTGVAFTSGFFWAIWHWPLIINGLYGNSMTPLYYQIIIFTLFIMSTAMIMTYLRYKTKSVWSAVIYHMSSNVFIQKFFNPLTLENPKSVWFIDEFGIILAMVAMIVAIYFWKKGKQEFANINLWA